MRSSLSVLALTAGFAVAGCNPSLVQPDEPLYRNTLGAPGDAPEARSFHLALPLSGPQFRHANVFGEGLVLPAGLRVHVDAVERGRITGRPPPDWDAMHPRSVSWVRRVYRVRFHTDAGACSDGCVAHWRAADDRAFEQHFHRVFSVADPLAGVGEGARDLVASHRVAAWFDASLVRLALGAPNAVVDSGGSERWVYEERFCQGYQLVAVPRLALDFEAGRLSAYARLDAGGFYRPFEPVDVHAGLCRPSAPAPEELLRVAGNGDYVSRLEERHASHRPVHRLIDYLAGGTSVIRPGRRPPISEGRSRHQSKSD